MTLSVKKLVTQIPFFTLRSNRRTVYFISTIITEFKSYLLYMLLSEILILYAPRPYWQRVEDRIM